MDTKESLREYVYDYLFEQQGWRCCICNAQAMRQRLSIDHCHKTGKIRWLLCDMCNKGIGMFQDNPAMLEAAITYLKNRQDRVPDWDYSQISSHTDRAVNKLDLYDLQFHEATKWKYANNKTLDLIDKYTDWKHDEVQVVCNANI